MFLCQDVFPEVARLLEDFQNEQVEAVLTRIGRFTVRQADRIIALGDTMKRRLVETKGADPREIRVIHNWADADGDSAGSEGQPVRARARPGRQVRRHAFRQRRDVAGRRRAARRRRTRARPARRRRSRSSAKARGRRFCRRRPQRAALPNVRFFPYQPKARLIDSFAAADVFIVSLKRGLAGFIVPSKLYGILAAGRPFIAAVEDDCEAAQIAREHDCGVVVEPGDRDAMASAIRQLYQDAAERDRLARNAREAGLTYSRRRAVEAYRDLLEDICV